MSLRIGILGCGRMSRKHARKILAHPDAKIAALCDVGIDIIENWIEEYLSEELVGRSRPPMYTDSVAMYREENLDAVVICTPHTVHFAHGKQALSAGCHIYMEKPMVTSTEEARKLAELAGNSGRILVVGYNTPCTSAFRYLRDVIRSQKLGKLELVDGFLSQNWKQMTTGTWRQDPALSGGGQAYDSGAHLLNSVVWAIESPPEQVFSFMDFQKTLVDINSVLSIRFANRVMASIAISGNCSSEGAALTFIFSGGRIEIDGWNGSWIRVFKDGEEIKPDLPDGSLSPIDNFVDSVLGRAEPATTTKDGVIFSQLMDAIYNSHETGCVSIS